MTFFYLGLSGLSGEKGQRGDKGVFYVKWMGGLMMDGWMMDG